MKRIRIYMLIFFAALTIPLSYLILKTHHSLEQEEASQLRYFAEKLFDNMEEELANLIIREEGRAIDEFNYYYTPPGWAPFVQEKIPSPLSRAPREDYVLGYLQNNPDGSFQTPLIRSEKPVPEELAPLVNRLAEVNDLFNHKRTQPPEAPEVPKPQMEPVKEQQVANLADRFLNLTRTRSSKDHLGRKGKRKEEISAFQAYNVAQMDSKEAPADLEESEGEAFREQQDKSNFQVVDRDGYRADYRNEDRAPGEERKVFSPTASEPAPILEKASLPSSAVKFQVEVDPMQSVSINDRYIFIFRRIVMDNQIYRQGLVIDIKLYMDYLIGKYFTGQPMARFTALSLEVLNPPAGLTQARAGAPALNPEFVLHRTFPRPFSFLRATLAAERIPHSPGRSTLSLMLAVLAAVILMGLLAIYQSARVVVDLSDRRSRFVSSVTHELKTPLTNIRMYIEMLEQGIAPDREREDEYFRILGSECGRLSRLINNVLEFSKLETGKRRMDMQQGTMEEVIQEAAELMGEHLRQEGFSLRIEGGRVRPCRYDREVMVQVLINLLENSIKFGRHSQRREITLSSADQGPWVNISVSDTGPGIPRRDLKKIFDDFYRSDGPTTRNAKGTGIGLALVKKFVRQMKGRVAAANNDGPGCTITISLPVSE